MKQTIGSVFWLVALLLFAIPGADAFELNGFADVKFTKCDNKDCSRILGEEGGRNGNPALGTLDFYLSQEVQDVDILMELVVENGSAVDLERLILGYEFNDKLRFRMGRFHTPLGFWNTSYHHGVQLQTTINRPEFLKFEDDGGILPVHTVGVYLSGKFRSPQITSEYGLMAGSGPRITSEDGVSNLISPNNISDNNMGKSVAVSLAFSSPMIEGLKVGVSGHITRVESDGKFVPVSSVNTVDVDQDILGAALSYSLENIDLMGEYFSIRDKDNIGSSGSNTSSAYYALVSYTFVGKWTPYLLYENMSLKNGPGEDPYFIALGTSDVKKTTAGLRYNINIRSSLKFEWRNVEHGNAGWHEYGFQWGLSF